MENAKRATLYRMVMPEHVCPYGLKSKWLLESHGYQVDDHWLRTREETDVFKAEHNVATTPQTFIEGERVGGNDDLRAFFGKHVPTKDETSYRPVIALFAMTALMALAASQAAMGSPFTVMNMVRTTSARPMRRPAPTRRSDGCARNSPSWASRPISSSSPITAWRRSPRTG